MGLVIPTDGSLEGVGHSERAHNDVDRAVKGKKHKILSLRSIHQYSYPRRKNLIEQPSTSATSYKDSQLA
jgi:hypothetical protein